MKGYKFVETFDSDPQPCTLMFVDRGPGTR
jgi:hypothetical protein